VVFVFHFKFRGHHALDKYFYNCEQFVQIFGQNLRVEIECFAGISGVFKDSVTKVLEVYSVCHNCFRVNLALSDGKHDCVDLLDGVGLYNHIIAHFQRGFDTPTFIRVR
jgi:hypothetical protein